MPFLMVRHLTKDFGGLKALDCFDLDIEKQEIRGLIGPNGAGKSTLFNVISGIYKPDEGEVIFDGIDITGFRSDKVAAKGVVRTFQENVLFREMTVLDNMIIGRHQFSKVGFLHNLLNSSSARLDEKESRHKVMDILEFLDLLEIKFELAKNLPHGHQRLLGVGMALAVDPQILLMDEPVAGMSPESAAIMTKHIKDIRAKMGITVVLVEHNIRVVTGLCDKITVLNYGCKIAEDSPNNIVNDPEVIKAYLGTRKADDSKNVI